MADLVFRFPIHAPAAAVFSAVASPEGLAAWWTLSSKGEIKQGAEYSFYFSDEFRWKGVLSEVTSNKRVKWTFTDAEPDWTNTTLSFDLSQEGEWTWLEFRHANWGSESTHFRVSSYCWAMYLRHLKRYVEDGIVVAYDKRDND
ncbi:MAG: SRPBCC domain-containing protein [Bacteroidetes bacterium]|nr:SRPBCC domain-containing protein [Bacteroidota bacterium]